ncbi:hypothetical protein QBC38DRAFT_439007 [Podospora fimiseda]|uniref:Pyrroloquinoline quinone-dependent pyranose dehydrogenase beta-propeller domain-containing protein n=1 Tax=Podospora fimiseda TaxID=252190 RepID=A0AAN7H2N4_9PEZI|nr:hypothetical protein QBC38DRAFT_439007 [Podospora fimiseda]
MVRLFNQAAIAAALLSLASSAHKNVCGDNALKPQYKAPNDKFPIPSNGWRAQLIHQGLRRPRAMVWDSKGALLMTEGAGVVYFNVADNNGCLSLENKIVLVNDTENYNHGIQMSPDGTHLYVSTPDQVHQFDYDPSTPSISNRKTIIQNMIDEDHWTRTLFLSSKSPDTLLVSRGSWGNWDEAAAFKETPRAQIRSFNISLSITSSPDFIPYDFPTQGKIIGWGLRNSVGITEHPQTGGIYSVENSADHIHRMSVDIHIHNPGEELNFHGYLNGSFPEGENFGYPHCFALYDPTLIPNPGTLQIGNNFALENKDLINDETCNRDYIPPRLTFMAHMAPLDIKFDVSGKRAFISFHGSWNRPENDTQGYKVSYVEFDSQKGEPLEKSTNNSAIIDIIRNVDSRNCRETGCFRPAGLLWDNHSEKKRLFVSNDQVGEIWVLEEGNYKYDEFGNEIDENDIEDQPSQTEEDVPAEASTSSPAMRVFGGGVGTEGWMMIGFSVLASFVGGVWFIVA